MDTDKKRRDWDQRKGARAQRREAGDSKDRTKEFVQRPTGKVDTFVFIREYPCHPWFKSIPGSPPISRKLSIRTINLAGSLYYELEGAQ